MGSIEQTCFEKNNGKRDIFTRFSQIASKTAGKPGTFGLAVFFIILWAASGPMFGFSDTWQLIVNTSTTIITFLMVFLIQNSQNRDTEALQLKLDELLRVTKGAHNALMDIEELSESELEEIRKHYLKLAQKARDKLDTTQGNTAEKLRADDGDDSAEIAQELSRS